MDEAQQYLADLELALKMAAAADQITMSRFKALDLEVKTKPDLTPVTDADTATEAALRKILATERATDAIIGEEYDNVGSSNRQWIIDPIDGTKNFARSVPVWATLIALMVDGEVKVGVVSAPALGKRWWASQGYGAYTGTDLSDGVKISTSKVDQLENAFLSYSSITGWADCGRKDAFVDLLMTCGRTRAFGDFWSYMMVAEGVIDFACEPELELHDMAALEIIVRQAGGTFTNIDGLPGVAGPGALATNGPLFTKALAAIAKA